MHEFQSADKKWWTILKYAKGKKIILFGTGVKAKRFFDFHLNHVPIYMVVDNDVKKQNLMLGDVIEGLDDTVNEGLIINPVEKLRNINKEDVLVFIANAKPEPLINQLKEIGCIHFLTFERWWNLQMDLPLNLKINAKKIIFFIYMHGAHEKAITKQLLRYRLDLELVWVVDRVRDDLPSNVKMVSSDDVFDCNCEARSAKIWITGLEILNSFFKKRNEQIYIQVKHWSSLTLKVFGPECNKKVVTNEEYEQIVNAYIDNRKKMDVILSGSVFDEESCRKGMLYNGNFVRVGSPRSDVMFDVASVNRVYEYIGITKTIKLAMYAPTFRWPFSKADPIHGLDFEKLYNSLRKRFSGEWRLLLRLHPLVAEEARGIEIPSYVSNVSDYDDSEELAAAADITITDYSSIMFEPAFLYKPVFLYAPDKEEYQKEHPLLMEYDKLPFSVSTDNQGLERAILEFNENDYKLKLQEMFDKYDVHEDGHASERAAMYILGLLDSKG